MGTHKTGACRLKQAQVVWGLILLLMIAPGIDAGEAPSGKVLDILSDSQGENIERVTVMLDIPVSYKIDETDLNNSDNPQLLVEIENAVLDEALGSGLGTSIAVKRNGVLRIEAVASPQTRRVYVYIELSEPRSYRELSKSPTKRIELEIHPASGQAGRIVTPGQTSASTAPPGRRIISSSVEKSERSRPATRPVGSASLSQRSSAASGSGAPSSEPSLAAPTPASGQSIPQPGSTLAHVYGVKYKRLGEDKLHVIVELDRPVQPQITRKAEGIRMLLPNTLLALRQATGSAWMREQNLDVQQGAVQQIVIRQASIAPEQVVVVVKESYPTAYQLLSADNPNHILLEIETQKRAAPPATPAKKMELPQGRVEGNRIVLPVGQSITLDLTLEPSDTVVIGDPSVADAAPTAANSLIINGKQRGLTNLEVRDRYNRRVASYLVQVYEDWSWLEQELESELGEPVQVKVRNGTVFLEGEVDTSEQAQRAEQIARALVGNQGEVHSLITIRSQSSRNVAERLKRLLESEDLPQVDVQVENGRIILTGHVSRQADLQRAENLARFFSDNVLNSLEVELPETLAQKIQAEIGLPDIKVQLVNDSAIVRGTVRSAEERDRVEQIAALYVPRVTNLVEVRPAHPSAEEIQSLIGLPEVQVRWSGDVLVLSGTANTQLESSMAEQIGKRFATSVVNNIRVNRQDQVNIKVRVIEINRNASSRLGIDWTNVVHFQEEFIPRGRLNELYKMGRAIRTDAITATINALLEEGLARVLVDTNLTTLSGKTAELHSGGELPLVSTVATGQNLGTVFGEQVRPFGVRLQITPTVDEQGFITVELQPEVSSINEADTVSTPLGRVPTFNVRTLNATVRVQSGETFAIGGVMQQRESVLKTKLPLLGQIPILGALFTTRHKTNQETELVFILTPTIVQPGMANPTLSIPENPFPEKKAAPPPTPAPAPEVQESRRMHQGQIPQQIAETESEPFEW